MENFDFDNSPISGTKTMSLHKTSSVMQSSDTDASPMVVKIEDAQHVRHHQQLEELRDKRMADFMKDKVYTLTRHEFINKVSQIVHKIMTDFNKKFLEDLDDPNVQIPIRQSSLIFGESMYTNPHLHRIFTNTKKPNPIAKHYGIGVYKGPFHMDLKELKIEKILKDHLVLQTKPVLEMITKED